MQALGDPELSEVEQQLAAIRLLFEDKPIPQDIATCIEAVSWFLTGWDQDNHSDRGDEPAAMDFTKDQWRIYSAFRCQYGINLMTDELHFWEFMSLLTTLEECAFTRVMEIRRKKESKNMSQAEKKALRESKKIYSLAEKQEKALTPAELEFLKYAKRGPEHV